MGLKDALFGSDSKSVADSKLFVTQDTASEGGSSTNSTGSQRTDAQQRKGLAFTDPTIEIAIQALGRMFGGFSKEAAVADSKAQADSTLAQVLNSGLGSILGVETLSGGINSSSARIAKENVLAKAIAAASSVTADTIKNYAQTQQGIAGEVSKLLALSQDSNTQTGQSTSTEQIVSELKKLYESMSQKQYGSNISTGQNSGSILAPISLSGSKSLG